MCAVCLRIWCGVGLWCREEKTYGMPLIIFSNSSHHGAATLLCERTSAISDASFSFFDWAM
jgi:hypothetical protein